MTTQTLTDNRIEIIEKINEIGNVKFIKEIMTAMVRLIDGEMNESDNVIDLVQESIELSDSWRKESKMAVFHRIEETNLEASRNQRPSWMR